MYLVATFLQTLDLELAISDLLHIGLKEDEILAVPLQLMSGNDGVVNKVIDSAAVSGTALMVLGVIYGFVLRWGPVIWGLIGLLIGAAAGAFLALARSRLHYDRKRPKRMTAEVVLMVNCRDDKVRESEQILWANKALGVGRLNK